MAQALALKYRPTRFEELTEQSSVVKILTNQINTNTIKNGYLFCGGAGTGKTTSARIFASMINKGVGEPIELDAASNNSVEDIRRINEEAQTMSLDSEYKVFIIDECFPSDTLISTEVGEMPIKNIKPGLKVKSMTGFNTVTHVFNNSVLTSRLCCVTINNKKLVTTVDHLFFTNNGWVKAVDLCKGDIVYGTNDMQKLWETIPREGGTELYSEVLLSSVFCDIPREESNSKNQSAEMSSLWEGNNSSYNCLQENLFRSLQTASNIEVNKSDYEYRIWNETTETVIRKDVEVQSITQSGSVGKSTSYEREKRHFTSVDRSARWEREVHNSTDSLIRSLRNWMDSGIPNTNGLQSARGERSISYVLQSRPRLSPNETCSRGGWSRPQLEKISIKRCEENSTAGKARVESSEVYKRGYNDELFLGSFTSDELSEDYVTMYDIEVENDHCYFANDVLVHNCHMLSTSAWNAFLKTLEEPPTKSIFILCTTNPEKIPATILSRVQRYNFQRISHEGICKRLLHILECEDYIVIGKNDTAEVNEVVSYLAKMADGGMRDAITLLDKILSYSDDLSMKSVLTALGAADYDTMYNLTYAVCELNSKTAIEIINEVFNSGVDLKQFIKDYFEFVLDINTYWTVGNMDCVKIPTNWKNALDSLHNSSPAYYTVKNLLEMVVNLMNEIKWVQNPKSVVIARFILFINKEGEVK